MEPRAPLPLSATFNDLTLEVICVFDRPLRAGESAKADWSGKIWRAEAWFKFKALANPVAEGNRVVFTAQDDGLAFEGPNTLSYGAVTTPRLYGITGVPVAAFDLLNFTLV